MNWIRKTCIFVGLTLVFLFAFSANEVAVNKIHVEKSSSSLSNDHIHSYVFVEPQAIHTLIGSQKTSNLSFSKYLENYLVVSPDLKIDRFFIRFANQDINRCEKVSLLLFPFHIFW